MPLHLQSMSRRAGRIAMRVNLAAVVLLACAIFGMVNYLSMRHHARLHWRRDLFAALSEKSVQLLAAVPDDIRVVALLRPAHEASPPATALLQEYAARAPNLSVESVDPERDLARAEQLARTYRLPGAECVVFEIGGRHQAVAAADLVEYENPGAESPRRFFRGEQMFTSAIYTLTQGSRPVVFFLQGHGERSPDDFDPRSGYSRIASRLRDENLEVETLTLGEARAVPNLCALMVVAGPAKEFAPFEVALIRD